MIGINQEGIPSGSHISPCKKRNTFFLSGAIFFSRNYHIIFRFFHTNGKILDLALFSLFVSHLGCFDIPSSNVYE